jgi:ABC-type glucose/galactose transport system permease subunit
MASPFIASPFIASPFIASPFIASAGAELAAGLGAASVVGAVLAQLVRVAVRIKPEMMPIALKFIVFALCLDGVNRALDRDLF